MPKLLAAFDFDHTIVNENADVVVRNLLKGKAPPFTNGKGWTDYMQDIFNLLYNEGTREEHIRAAVHTLKEVPGFFDLLSHLNQSNAEVIIISDANSYLINTWLAHKRVSSKIRRVFTNPAKFVEGRLMIEKYHLQDWCNLSTVNLCKGYILENYIEERKKDGVLFDNILYIGDGTNDYCPSLKLSNDDVTFPRKGYAFMKKLEQLGDKHGIKAKIQPWTSHSDILEFIKVHFSH